jgi:hypothetical protein
MPETEKHVAILLPGTLTGEAYLGTLQPHPSNPANFHAVKVGDQWLGVEPHQGGAFYFTTLAPGPWQAFKLGDDVKMLIAAREDGKTYTYPYVAYSGPVVP